MSGQPVFIRLTTMNGRRFFLDANRISLFGPEGKDGESTCVVFRGEDDPYIVCETPDEIVLLLKAAGVKCWCLDGGVAEEVEP